MNDFLQIPGIVALVGGVGAYLYQQTQKWLSINALLEAEINHLLADARENLAFLERDSHYWLIAGTTLKSGPNAFPSNYKVFDAVLKDIYILGRTRATNVLLFYEFYLFCEKLRGSLFEHVKRFHEAGKPLLDQDVSVLRARLNRCRQAFKSLDEGYPARIFIRQLRSNYPRPSEQEVLKAITEATKT